MVGILGIYTYSGCYTELLCVIAEPIRPYTILYPIVVNILI